VFAACWSSWAVRETGCVHPLDATLSILRRHPLYSLAWGAESGVQGYSSFSGVRCYQGTGATTSSKCPTYCALIRLKHIYNFLCSMLIYTPFALCFVTLRGVLMHFLELTY
jgi:hypothetical protein